jgi:two-component system nitrate/nitrite response regulator NarL
VARVIPTIIVEQRTLLREGLASLLEGTHYDVRATVAGVNEIAAENFERAALVIVGVSAGMDKAVAAIRRLRHILPDAKLFMVADGADRCDSQELLSNGADGCILDVTSQEVLLKSLDLALLQQRLIVIGHSGRVDQVAPAFRGGELATGHNEFGADIRLSDRERQILACLARGESNKAIARHCYVAETTVKAHLKAILRKIGVQNRTQAAVWAIDHGLVAAGAPDDAFFRTPLPQAS